MIYIIITTTTLLLLLFFYNNTDHCHHHHQHGQYEQRHVGNIWTTEQQQKSYQEKHN